MRPPKRTVVLGKRHVSGFIARRRANRSVKLGRPSRIATFFEKRRAAQGVVIDKPGRLARYIAKRQREQGVLLAKPKKEGKIRFVPAVVAVVVVAGLVVGEVVSDNMDDDEELAAVTTTTATTTTVAPTTTTEPLPVDAPAICRSRDEFIVATASLDPTLDRASVVAGLELMSTALVGLGEADTHPDLVSSVDVLSPVVTDALATVQQAVTDDLASFASDPRFADPSFAEAVGTIMGYPLNCAAGG
jgi:hypothetical protein